MLYVLDVSTFSGADLGAKVNACISAIERAAGGGTLRCAISGVARNRWPRVSFADDGTHSVTLLLPVGVITRGSGAQFVYDNSCRIIGQGRVSAHVQGTQIAGNDAVATFIPANEGGTRGYSVEAAYLGHFSISNSDITTGSIGIEVGGVTGSGNTDVQDSIFEDIGINVGDKGVATAGPNGNTAYNHFKDIYSFGTNYGLYAGLHSNSNIFEEGGRYGGGIAGIYENGNFNVYIKPDIENASSPSIEFAGTHAFVFMPYEESGQNDVFDSGAAYNSVSTTAIYQPTDNSGNLTNQWVGVPSGQRTVPISLQVQNEFQINARGGGTESPYRRAKTMSF